MVGSHDFESVVRRGSRPLSVTVPVPGYSFVHCLELGIDGGNELLYYFVVNNDETPFLDPEIEDFRSGDYYYGC